VRLFAALAAATVLVCACKPNSDDAIRVDRVPKETEQPIANTTSTTQLPDGHPAINNAAATPAMAGTGGMTALPGMAEFTAATPTPKWSPPADWVADEPNPMRKGSWHAPASAAKDKQAEIAISVFSGQLGGLLLNVNRWRGKVGLAGDVTNAQLPQSVQNITIGGRTAQLLSLDGPDGQSLDGVLVILPDKVWSLLLSGPTDAVKAERPAFRAFLDGIQWQD